MDDLGHTPFFFGAFRLHRGEQALARDGVPIPLTPKEFDTLVSLVEAKGRVVSKEELMSRVWPDSYVGDGSLARNISILRKALGEEVIETLPRRGYRLTLPVSSLPASGTSPPPASTVATAPAWIDDIGVVGPAPWWKHKFAAAVAVATVLLIVLASRFLAIHSAGAGAPSTNSNTLHSVLIRKEGATDPSEEGFTAISIGKLENHVMRNLDNHGVDRLRVIAEDQGFYYRTLSSTEKDFVLQRDWKLTCVCALQKGAAFSNVDFGVGKVTPRFDINFLQEGDKYFVALTKQISPDLEWEAKIEFPGVGDIDHPHTYELRYDHISRSASLWIDGHVAATRYHGVSQFLENRGLFFGATIYLDGKPGIGVFRSVRFEAN